jgi:hypothetical protein
VGADVGSGVTISSIGAGVVGSGVTIAGVGAIVFCVPALTPDAARRVSATKVIDCIMLFVVVVVVVVVALTTMIIL